MKQNTLLSNNSVLPQNIPQVKNKSLDSITFSSYDIAKIKSHLDPNKACSYYMLRFSVQMTKLCRNSL